MELYFCDNKFLMQFMPLVSFDTPLEASENLWFSDVFRGAEIDQWHEMGYCIEIR